MRAIPTPTRSLEVLLALALLTGCGSTATPGNPITDDTGEVDVPAVEKDVPKSTDLGTPDDTGATMDAGFDVPAIDDVVTIDQPVVAEAGADGGSGRDVPATPDLPAIPDGPPVSCRRDGDCAAAVGRPACDVVSGFCVQCVPTADACPTGSYCDASRRCVAGCRNGSDCVGAPGGPLCDPARRACVGCLGDTDCALGSLCSMGACVQGCNTGHGCATGSTCCSGVCISTSTSVAACGACAHACSTIHSTPTCAAGACVAGCDTGWGDCDTNRDNGCETSTLSNPANCGGCGVVCSLAHASAMCATDHCAVVACSAGYQDCDHLAMTGCEAALTTDVNNCGACGNTCARGQSCVAGACQCPAGQTICLGACTATQTDPLNCGACNLSCPAGQTCAAGACSALRLYHGWASPIAGCLTSSYNTTAATALGGTYPFIAGDSPACRAWKLAATVCTTQPVLYSDTNNWQCPQSGGFTDPVFGTYCAYANQYSCSTCPGACNAGTCRGGSNTLRNCSGSEIVQP